MAKYTIEEAEIAAELIKHAMTLLASVPMGILEALVASTDRDVAIGPLLEPSKFRGGKFDELERIKQRTLKIIELKKMFETEKSDDSVMTLDSVSEGWPCDEVDG